MRSNSTKRDFFLGTIKGRYGLWKRTTVGGKKSVALAVQFTRPGHTKPKWRYEDTVQRVVEQVAAPLLKRWIDEAPDEAINRYSCGNFRRPLEGHSMPSSASQRTHASRSRSRATMAAALLRLNAAQRR